MSERRTVLRIYLKYKFKIVRKDKFTHIVTYRYVSFIAVSYPILYYIVRADTTDIVGLLPTV